MKIKLYFDGIPPIETELRRIIKGNFPQQGTDPKITKFEILTPEIKYGQPFKYVADFALNSASKEVFSKWLKDEDFKFEVSWSQEIVYYSIQCDDCMDAAKIETFINTEI